MYIVCVCIYIYTYSVYIYIHIYIQYSVCIYIYMVSGPSGGLHFHMFRGIFYFHIYIYTVCVYIYCIDYIYVYILYIRFSCGPSPKSQISLKCAEMSWNSQHSQGQLSRFSEFPRLQCWWNYIFIYNFIYIIYNPFLQPEVEAENKTLEGGHHLPEKKARS